MELADFINLETGKINTGAAVILALLAIWELVWKGMGMWRAAQNHHKAWFVAILIVNSVGILPILYLYLLSKKANKPQNVQ